jgi:hypothetical protein
MMRFAAIAHCIEMLAEAPECFIFVETIVLGGLIP